MKKLAMKIEGLPWQILLPLTILFDGIVGGFYRLEKKHYIVGFLMIASFTGIILSLFPLFGKAAHPLFWICVCVYLLFWLGDILTVAFLDRKSVV